jgi:hypothetical protein
MSVDQVTLLFAFLALATLMCTVALAGWMMVARFTGGSARLDALRRDYGTAALLVGALIAFFATGGSLYLSEVADFPPCRLCWYQRIAMYPLGPLLAMAYVRRDRGIAPYGILLASLGAIVSIYHVVIERFPDLEVGTCELANPCSIIWIEKLGVFTIPAMALTAFAGIITVLAFVPSHSDTESPKG